MVDTKIEDLPHYTYDEYKLWEGSWEIIDGIPYAMSPAPTIKHQAVSSKIAWQLEELLKDCPQCQALLPVDWKISDDTVVQPDNLVICHTPANSQFIRQAPEIIFEILSKSTAKKDKDRKYQLYQKEGVKFYIIVDCDETLTFEIDKCVMLFDFSKIW